MSFYVAMFLFLLDIYLGMEFLGYVVTLFSILRNCQTVFPNLSHLKIYFTSTFKTDLSQFAIDTWI